MSTGPDEPRDHDDAVAADVAVSGSHHNGSAEQPQPEPMRTPRSEAQGSSRTLENAFVRVIATSGIVGIAVALAAILGSQKVAAWIIGFVASTLSVLLAALIWSSRPN